MKSITFIIALYITVLTALPFVSYVNTTILHSNESCDKNCCNNKNESKSGKSQQTGICNPFQSCAYCFAFIPSASTFEPLFIQEIKVSYPLQNVNFISNFSSSYFHPPDSV